MKCPVCNNEVDSCDICEVCNWQNSGPGEKDHGLKGPNKMYLWEAKEAYKNGEEVE